MKNSLRFLPKKKQTELQAITDVILKNCAEVEMIILYGSYARGTYKEPWDIELNKPGFRQISDYDILVVTSTKEVAQDLLLWDKIYTTCQGLKKYIADPRIVTHDIKALNLKLAAGQYFYSDIVKDGVILYDSKKFKLSEKRDLSSQERKIIAQDHYDVYFKDAQDFFRSCQWATQNTSLKHAAFHLHQAAEHAYKTILLVFSNYVPKEHLLETLGKQSEIYSSLLKNILAKQTKDEEHRFKLLDYAYIGGRYDPNYQILPS
jgi:HEPN domain-containing protein/predicted nucleotidyltransferase